MGDFFVRTDVSGGPVPKPCMGVEVELGETGTDKGTPRTGGGGGARRTCRLTKGGGGGFLSLIDKGCVECAFGMLSGGRGSSGNVDVIGGICPGSGDDDANEKLWV